MFRMTPKTFPNPRSLRELDFYAGDIVTFGEPLTLENLREAYRKGIFPWHIDGMPLPWFCPAQRAILEFENLHIPKSLARERRKTNFAFTVDNAFEDVINACAKTKRNFESGTWITEGFIEAYKKFHNAGIVHSVEVWDEDVLVGGLYGVDAGGVFCGESMFFEKANASKLALLFLIEHLKSRGASWIDIQVMTPHMEVLGAHEIDRNEFLDKLRLTQEENLRLF